MYQIVNSGKRLIDGDAINRLANLGSFASTYGITAHAGGGRTSAVALNYGLNIIAVCATTSDSVLLPTAEAGSILFLANGGAANAQVFGKGSDTVNGTAGATGIALTAGTAAFFCSGQDGAWFSQGSTSGAGSFTDLVVSGTASFAGAISSPAGTGTTNGTLFGVTAGVSGSGVTGNGGALTLTGGAAASTNGVGGVSSLIGGAGRGTQTGGIAKVVGGVGGATGAGGAGQLTGGAGGATSGVGGNATVTAGAAANGGSAGGISSLTGGAGNGTGAGGASNVVGGASGAGATGNGGAVGVTGGAAGSTAGNGGSVILTGGVKTTTGVAGMIIKRSVELVAQGAPAAKTVSATLTAAEILTGIITTNQGSAGATAQQLPIGADMDTAIPDAVAGDAFDFSVINISTDAAEDATVTTNTGWTLVGSMFVASNAATTDKSAGRFRARKTGSALWVLYRLA